MIPVQKPELYERVGSQRYRCLLCPHFCVMTSKMTGFCNVRSADIEGIHAPEFPVTVMAVDPVEKKPFYHFLPGTQSLSVGFAGCNLRCPFCQNHSLVDSTTFDKEITSERILKEALKLNTPTVSLTYSEPLVHIEFLVKTARLLKENGISPLLVTNGCINSDPGQWLLSFLDGVKVDLKSFDSHWYAQELKGELDAVKNFISMASEMTHLEVVTLIIPGKNDSVQEIREASHFLSHLNPDIPYHLTAYFPQHHYDIPSTSTFHLEKLKKAALEQLSYVYTGNTGRVESTYCNRCGSIIINRKTGTTELSEYGCCLSCGKSVYGKFA